MREDTDVNGDMTAKKATALRDMIEVSVDAVCGAPKEAVRNRSFAVVEISETDDRIVTHRLYLVNAEDGRLLELATEAKREKDMEKVLSLTAATSIPAITIRSLDMCGFADAVNRAADMANTVSCGANRLMESSPEERGRAAEQAMRLVC